MEAILYILLVLNDPNRPAGQTAPRAEPARVGEISVVGNTRTGDRAILDCLTFSSAQLLPTEKEIVENEFKLLMKFYKRFDMDNGKRPRISDRTGVPARTERPKLPRRAFTNQLRYCSGRDLSSP